MFARYSFIHRFGSLWLATISLHGAACTSERAMGFDGAVRHDGGLGEDVGPDGFVAVDGGSDARLDGGQADGDASDSGAPLDCSGMDTWTGDYTGNGEELAGYQRVTGDIFIAGHIDVVNMANLACLEIVDNDVTLAGLWNLTSLDGLESLRSVGGQFRIGNNRSLADISALSALVSVQGLDIDTTAVTTLDGLRSLTSVASLSLTYNPELVDIEGLSRLTEFPNGLTIIGNTRLTQLAGLGSCIRVGGLGLSIVGNNVTDLDDLSSLIELTSLSLGGEALRSVSGLAGVSRIDGRVVVSGTGLANLDGLRLTEIAGELIIESNANLTRLRGLEMLESVSGNLFVFENEMLSDIGALAAFTQSGGIWFENNERLRNLDGLSGLDRIDGDLALLDNALLDDITGLRGVGSVQGYIRIEGNEALTRLNGLDSLASVDEYITIQGEALVSLEGLASLTSASDFYVVGTSVTDLGGLEQLLTVGRVYLAQNQRLIDLSALQMRTADELELSNNSALVSLAGLEQLEQLRFGLSIKRNGGLTSLDGLEGLTTVGDGLNGDLDIQANVALSDIQGLRSLTLVQRTFRFRNNRALCRSSILSLLSAINDATDPDLLVPPSDIMGNRSGC